MPERRLGFGHDAVLELISLIRNYSEKFPQMIKSCMPSPSWTLTAKCTEKKTSASVRISSRRWTACWRTSPCGQGRRSDRNNQGTILCPFGILLSRIFGIPPFRASLQWPGFTGTNRTGRIPCPQCPICLQQAAYPRPLHL